MRWAEYLWPDAAAQVPLAAVAPADPGDAEDPPEGPEHPAEEPTRCPRWKRRAVRTLDTLEHYYRVTLAPVPPRRFSRTPEKPPPGTDETGWAFRAVAWPVAATRNAFVVARFTETDVDACRGGKRPRATLRKLLASYTYVVVIHAMWFGLFIGLVFAVRSAARVTTDAGASIAPSNVGCYDRYATDPETCGLGMQNCAPFANVTMYLRCGALCASAAPTNYRYLGLETVPAGTPWVVGSAAGGVPVRGDSYICATALQAGLISDATGGCFKLAFSGGQSSFSAIAGSGALSFDSWFPFSFAVTIVASTNCADVSLVAAFPTMFVVMMLVAWACGPPTAAWLWTTSTLAVYFSVLYFTDTQWTDAFISAGLGTLVPAAALVALLYRYSGGREVTLAPLTHPVEVLLLWIPFLWFGATINLWTLTLNTFALTSQLFSNSANVVVFVIGLLVLVVVAAAQLYRLRAEGRLPRMVAGYALFFAVFFAVAAITDMQPHFHHWFNAIVLFPLTRVRWRASIVYQAFLLGMFLNGAARWGLDSPLQATLSALTDAAPVGATFPTWTFNASSFATDHIVSWRWITPVASAPAWALAQPTPSDPTNQAVRTPSGQLAFCDVTPYVSYPQQWLSGYSLLVNGVEVYRGTQCWYNLSSVFQTLGVNLPYYLTVSYLSSGSSMGYSPPMEAFANGTCIQANGTAYQCGFL